MKSPSTLPPKLEHFKRKLRPRDARLLAPPVANRHLDDYQTRIEKNQSELEAERNSGTHAVPGQPRWDPILKRDRNALIRLLLALRVSGLGSFR
jgi:hypothetical protein